jgi:hypothetical protein
MIKAGSRCDQHLSLVSAKGRSIVEMNDSVKPARMVHFGEVNLTNEAATIATTRAKVPVGKKWIEVMNGDQL